MIKDPIVRELHRRRAEEMKRFNYDFEAFCRDLEEREKQKEDADDLEAFAERRGEPLLSFDEAVKDMRRRGRL